MFVAADCFLGAGDVMAAARAREDVFAQQGVWARANTCCRVLGSGCEREALGVADATVAAGAPEYVFAQRGITLRSIDLA